jgi:hypothetical protein
MDTVLAVCGRTVRTQCHTQDKHNRLERTLRGHAEQVIGICQSGIRQQTACIFPVTLRRVSKINRHDRPPLVSFSVNGLPT